MVQFKNHTFAYFIADSQELVNNYSSEQSPTLSLTWNGYTFVYWHKSNFTADPGTPNMLCKQTLIVSSELHVALFELEDSIYEWTLDELTDLAQEFLVTC